MNDLPHYHIRGVTPYTFMRSLEPKSEPFIVEVSCPLNVMGGNVLVYY